MQQVAQLRLHRRDAQRIESGARLMARLICVVGVMLAAGCSDKGAENANRHGAEDAGPPDSGGSDARDLDASADSDAHTPDTAMDAPSDLGGGDADGGGAGTARHVQDYWIYETVHTVDDQGTLVDLAPDILASFSGMPDRRVQLMHGAEFQVYDELAGHMVDGDGEVRNDVEVVAGFTESPTGRALAAIATPSADASGPITDDDEVRVDLTFLGDKLTPGDPVIVEYAFMQSIPAEDPAEEAGLSGPELLLHRMEQGRIFFGAEEVDGEIGVTLFGPEISTAVEGSTQAGFPPKSQPMRDGLERGWRKCLGRSPLSCVAKHFRNFGDGADCSRRLIYDCNLGGGANCSCDPPPEPEPERCLIGCGKSVGEPHLETFDGEGFGLHLVGEFVAARSDSMELQIRTGPYGDSRLAAVTTGVAVEADGHRVNVFAGVDGGVVETFVVDGQPVEEETLLGTGIDLGPMNVRLRANTVRIEDSTGNVVYVDLRVFMLDVFLEPAEGETDWIGLFGNRDDDPTNDFKLRDGTVLPSPISNDAAHDPYGEDWRLSQDESLFYYDAGESTATYTDPTFPDERVMVEDLPADQRQRAEGICRAMGIIDDFALDACVFDYVMSGGDIQFVRSAQLLDVLAGIRAGARAPDGEALVGDCTDYETCVLEACQRKAVAVSNVSTPAADGSFSHDCPAGCDEFSASVFGTDIYTDDSSVCPAAIHYGAIGPEGGPVTFWLAPGQESYSGSTRNGVTSVNWASWPQSVVFQQEWSCDDMVDNDGDGDVDCDDTECGSPPCP